MADEEFDLNLPEDPIVEKKDLNRIFDLGPNAVHYWCKRKSKTSGPLRKTDDGRFDLRQVADWILARSDSGRQNPTLKPKARQIKKFYGTAVKEVYKKEYGKEVTKDEGIEFALQRVQQMEVQLAKKVEESLLDPSELVVSINNWNKILEILRKTETDCLKVLEEKKSLVRIDDVQDLYNKGILPAKTRLRLIPSSISQDLVGHDRAAIEEILEKEIDKALEGVSDIWSEDEE